MAINKLKTVLKIFISIVIFCLIGFLFPPFVSEAEATQITLSNAQSALNNAVSSSIALSSYTVPSNKGDDLVLVVWVAGESGASSEASSATFNGSSMTKIWDASTLLVPTGYGTYYAGGAFFWKIVSPGVSQKDNIPERDIPFNSIISFTIRLGPGK